MGGREGQRPDILSLDIAGGLVRARPDRLLREHGKRFELGQAGEANPDGRSGAQANEGTPGNAPIHVVCPGLLVGCWSAERVMVIECPDYRQSKDFQFRREQARRPAAEEPG